MWLYSKCRNEVLKDRLAAMLQTGFFSARVKSVQNSMVDAQSLDIECAETNTSQLMSELRGIPYISKVDVISEPPPPNPLSTPAQEILRRLLL